MAHQKDYNCVTLSQSSIEKKIEGFHSDFMLVHTTWWFLFLNVGFSSKFYIIPHATPYQIVHEHMINQTQVLRSKK